jgi:hypothetical protein
MQKKTNRKTTLLWIQSTQGEHEESSFPLEFK